MGLKPLEFSDCLLDSPYFRENIYEHEREIERSNDGIKLIIKECKGLMKAIETMSRAKRAFCQLLSEFRLTYIGEIDTEDEVQIDQAFATFSELIQRVEEERDRMLHHANIQLIEPLERFRKEQIGNAKEEKKRFDKETERYCQLLDKHTQLSSKKKDNILSEADSQIQEDKIAFDNLALEYVSKLQEVNEKKKFEFVEIMLQFMLGQSLFFHNGQDVYTDYSVYLTELQYKLQTTRERYEITQKEAEELKKKVKKKAENGEIKKGMYARQGYLYVQEKRKGGLGTTWTKHYCTYQKENKILTMIPFIQTMGKPNTTTDTMVVTSCRRRATEQAERRFCFDITGMDRQQPIILQALSEDDRKQWLEEMDGKEPIYSLHSDLVPANGAVDINDVGLEFVRKCICGIERRGITDQGLYRVAGVASKFNRLIQVGLDRRTLDGLDLQSDNSEWDVKTITSALKQYFRDLPQPLFTFKFHEDFIQAIKADTLENKVEALRKVVSKLPEPNYSTLKLFMTHLKTVASHSAKNLMQSSNLSVVLGPTLMRPEEETMAAIMNLKYQSIVIDIMIREYDQIFGDEYHASSIPLNQFNSSSNNNFAQTPPLPTKVHSPTTKAFNSNKANPPPPPPTAVGGNVPALRAKPKLPRPVGMLKQEESNDSQNHVDVLPPNSPPKFARAPHQVANPVVNQVTDNPFLKRDTVARRGVTPRSVGPAKGRLSDGTAPKATAPLASPDDADDSRSPSLHRESSEKPFQPIRSATSQGSLQRRTRVEDDDKLNLSPTRRSLTDRPPPLPKRKDWRVRALYNCVAENDSELSFSAGAIISNVRQSTEEGWLIGTLNGKTGLVPQNYVDTIDR